MNDLDPRRASTRTVLSTVCSTACLTAASVGLALTMGVGCDDKSKEAERIAVATLKTIEGTVPKDVDDVRKGMPNGAKYLSENLIADMGSNLAQAQEQILKARENDDHLRFAKSTMFFITNTNGVVIRSQNDTLTQSDKLVETNVFTAFPDLKKIVDGKGQVVETFGEMAEMRGVKQGDDTTWVIGAPLTDKEGKIRGAYVSGWSFRAYAGYLQTQAKRYLDEDSKKTGKIPAMFTYVVKDKIAYGASETPDANAKAIASLDLPAKVKNGPYQTHIEIDHAMFGVAAINDAKDLGENTALAVVVSVY